MYKPFKIKKAKNNLFYFVNVARNGKVLSTSETYSSKRRCYTGIRAAIGSVDNNFAALFLKGSYKQMVKDETI